MDGPSGSGKSSTSRGVASKLGLRYLDTGAQFRAMTWWMLQHDVDVDDADAVAAHADDPVLVSGTDPAAPTITVDGTDVAGPIRSTEVTSAVSAVSIVPAVRERLLREQRAIIGDGGIVVEGRDIGTVVAPGAAVKVYLTAAPERRNGPTALVFTRQGLPQQARSPEQLIALRKGGYVLIDSNGPPEAIVIATGSEVGVAVPAVKELQAAGKRVRLVSMPCCEMFDAQPAPYRESVLPAGVTRRVAVEAGSTQSWWRYVGSQGRVLGIESFGASGKGPELFKHFGITSAAVKALVEQVLS